MDSRAIRDRFLAFFAEREHTVVPSASLIPNDPTLLLTNAGMVPFKPFFLGEQTPPYKRAVSVQKCMRAGGKHNDIDTVGKTARHLTFFEMLGNFSFGDYYKEKACPYAWELVTEGYGLDPDRLWVTIYDTDDEAFAVWRDAVGVPERRIIRMGKKDNFWSMGVAGPCGPCSEIAYDLGEGFGPAAEDGPRGNEDRYIEIWNLVFMENDCNAQIEPVAELPQKNIDTGAGLERFAMVLQGVSTVFETDVLGTLVRRASELTKTEYGREERSDVALRILADHGRAVAFMLADGILPSNEGRGYVLRLIMRRAIRQARLLGRGEPVMDTLIETTTELMGDAYPELKTNLELALDVADREEHRFDETLKQGMGLLEGEMERARSGGKDVLEGDVAFRLHDTYGFPVDLTREIAEEQGLRIDAERFETLMEEQRDRARAARRRSTPDALGPGPTEGPADVEFVGYEHLRAPGRVVALSQDGAGSPAVTSGTKVDVILDRTPFYPEGGGQVGDRGTLVGPSGTVRVEDTQKVAGGVIVHRAVVTAGEIALGDEVEAIVDPTFREGTEQAHTATHILHWTLRDRLGEHARQAGSLVEPGRLRFDFSHFDALGEEDLADISQEMQNRVFADDGVRAYETSYEYATSIGAMAIFGEKYGDFVRVVEVGEYSKELCGGTHVPHTSQIGPVVVTSEGSIGANLRRIEALVGGAGLDFLKNRAHQLETAAALLKVAPDEVTERLERVLSHQKEMERKLAEFERGSAEKEAATLAATATDVDGTRLIVARKDLDVDALRALAQKLKGLLGSAVVVLGAAGSGRANLVGAVTKDLVERGISARELLAPGAALLGGGAGGKPELAVSGGPSADKIDEAIEAVAHAARAALRST